MEVGNRHHPIDQTRTKIFMMSKSILDHQNIDWKRKENVDTSRNCSLVVNGQFKDSVRKVKSKRNENIPLSMQGLWAIRW